MSNYELKIGPLTGRNAKTGRFMKGHVPANKGKKWDEYMPKKARKRCARGWKNLDLHRNKNGRPDNAGRCKKKVVAMEDGGKCHFFPYIGAAAKWAGGRAENVGRCCRQNSLGYASKITGKVNTNHKYKGYRFYFFDDDTWVRKRERMGRD